MTDGHMCINAHILIYVIPAICNNYNNRWNDYKDNNRKHLGGGGDISKQDFFFHFQSSAHNDFLEENEIKRIDKTTV